MDPEDMSPRDKKLGEEQAKRNNAGSNVLN